MLKLTKKQKLQQIKAELSKEAEIIKELEFQRYLYSIGKAGEFISVNTIDSHKNTFKKLSKQYFRLKEGK